MGFVSAFDSWFSIPRAYSIVDIDEVDLTPTERTPKIKSYVVDGFVWNLSHTFLAYLHNGPTVDIYMYNIDINPKSKAPIPGPWETDHNDQRKILAF